jgi:hypothetical protein
VALGEIGAHDAIDTQSGHTASSFFGDLPVRERLKSTSKEND